MQAELLTAEDPPAFEIVNPAPREYLFKRSRVAGSRLDEHAIQIKNDPADCCVDHGPESGNR